MHVATHTLCGWNGDNITIILDGTRKSTYLYKNDLYKNDLPSQEQKIQYKDPKNSGREIESGYGQDRNWTKSAEVNQRHHIPAQAKPGGFPS